MPIRELRCDTEGCANSGIVYEWFAKAINKPDPPCPECKVQMTRLLSTFATPFLGLLDRFKELGKERFNECGDGHWAWRNNLNGAPERVLIRTRQEQREHCKREGLIMPDEINPNAEINADGKTLQTSGMKGQWQTGLPSDDIRKTGNPWLYLDDE